MNRHRFRCFFPLLVVCMAAWLAAQAAGKRARDDTPPADAVSADSADRNAATRPVRAARHLVDRVLVISVDGLRPDMLLRCKTPHMHTLFQSGTYTFWARTTAVSITLPSHTSMLTGVTPRKHGIEWNRDLPLSRPVYPTFPTLFKVAKKAGYTTALIAGKSKFDTLAVPNTLDYQWMPEDADTAMDVGPDASGIKTAAAAPKKTKDADVAAEAVRVIRMHQPQVMFVHLPGVDVAGHAKGWGTPAQEVAVEAADEAVGELLEALSDAGLREKTVIILSSDHGGAGKTHGPDDPRSRHIPWIVNGPGIRRGVDLTTYADLEVHTEDTFATACYLLGIPLSPDLDGHPVMEVLADRGSLLHDLTHASATGSDKPQGTDAAGAPSGGDR